MVAVLFIVFLVALAIGVPVAFSLGLASVAYMLGSHIQMINFAQYFFKGLDSFTLLCIPGFTFAGNLMNQGGISDKLLDFADALVGHVTGGLAYANVLASMVFAGISGTALSDTVALGGVEIPMMVNQGYDVPFSVAITAASSCLGPIIPPSVPMIMAATMTGLSVSKMFMAGIVPGLLLGFGMCATCYILSVKRHYPKHERSSWKKRLEVTKDAIWALLMPIIILGGIYSGKFTPTEAAAVAAVIAGNTDPSVPINGAELTLFGAAGKRLSDNEIDQLVRGGVTPIETVGGVSSPVRGITTKTSSGGAADTTWRELTTILIVDEVIPTIRSALRTRFARSKNTAQSRGAIRSQVVLELEEMKSREIVDSYGEVLVSALKSDPTVCLVEFGFTVAHGLNRIYLTAHITV